MRFLLITDDEDLASAARKGLHPEDELLVEPDWRTALERCEGVDLLFVDQLATLREPHKSAGYQEFGETKMSHPVASGIPVVVISVPTGYDLDFYVGWPGFALGNLQRPVDAKLFRRASTWV